jgi:uncharacterized membrane protein YkoI
VKQEETTMRITRIFAALIAALCILSILPMAGAMSVRMDQITATVSSVSMDAASANDNYPISVEQAKNSVRLFINDLTLEPELSSTGSIEIGNYYILSTDTDSFYVNQNSGIVEFVHFGANEPDSADVKVTRDQAYSIATAYAGQKYDGYSGKSWKLVVDRMYEDYDWVYNETSQDYERIDISAYDFVLREEKEHVLLPNIVHVRVNANTGTIVDYWGVDRLVTAELKNTVSLSGAMETAENYYGLSDSFTISSSEGYLAVVTRSQNVENLAWVIKLKGYYSWDNDDERTYTIVVDAADGSVLGSGWSSIWPESRLSYLGN